LILFFLRKDKNKKFFFFSSAGVCSFQDSYAYPPSFYRLESYLQKTSIHWSFNRQRIQGHSDYCGYYAALFLLFKARNDERKFFSQFKTNVDYNDKLIQKLIKEFS
jgi:hypothetical protein